MNGSNDSEKNPKNSSTTVQLNQANSSIKPIIIRTYTLHVNKNAHRR